MSQGRAAARSGRAGLRSPRSRRNAAPAFAALALAATFAFAPPAPAAPAAGATVVLLRSRASGEYERAARSLRGAYAGALDELTLAGDPAPIERKVAALKPRTIVALGGPAAAFARTRFPRVPLVYAFVADPQRLELTGDVTGVSTEVPVEAEILGLRAVAPSVRRIGVVFGTDAPPRFLREARAAVAREGCRLIEIPVENPGDLTVRARESVGRVDGLWLPADASVATRESFRFLLELSLEHRKPLLVFAEPLVRSGALVAVCPDDERTGERLAEALRRIAAGERAGDIPIQRIDRTRLVVNRATARALGLELPSDAAKRAELLP